MNSPTANPIRKIRAVWISGGTATAAIAAVLLWVLPTFLDVDITHAAAGGLAALVVALITGAAGYQARNDPGDFDYRSVGKKEPDPTPVLKREKIN